MDRNICERKRSSNLGYYHGICLNGLRQVSGQDLSLELPKYESGSDIRLHNMLTVLFTLMLFIES